MISHFIRSSVLLTASMVLASCAENPGPLFIKKFYPMSEECGHPDDLDEVFVGNGRLDVAPGEAEYWIGIQVAGGDRILQAPVVVGGRTMEATNRDHPLLNEMVLTYSSKPRLAGFKTARMPVFAAFNETGEVMMINHILSAQAALILDNLPSSSDPADGTDLTVTVEFRGELSQSHSPITTGPADFPIRVVRSETANCSKLSKLRSPCTYGGQSFNYSVQPTLVCCDGQPGALGCD